ncbi:hypothetical protein [Micrococcus lylae]|uniref:Uncharacterized protein n=2 Tax=Micrococcus lylae TaxID=1273 RepID=A0ABY2K0T8_9MICC|nr:hypothetical protein [Micrococcus lylae]TFH97878.1 hypothetical protein E4A49_11415 [Micrococcus lylae]
MEMLPWFAWIPIVAILVWGAVQIAQLITGRSVEGLEGSGLSDRMDELEHRLSELESWSDQVGDATRRPAVERGGASGGESLEHRIERLEARADRREARDRDRDDWDRRAKDLGLED